MNKNFAINILSIALIVIMSACHEDLPQMAQYKAYEFESLDENGGNWNTLVLSSPDQIRIDPPESTSSSSFLSELEDLKEAQSTLSASKKAAINYWTNNPIIRWNEIALELVAKYNLIPGPNEDGTYTLPSPSNPQGPPPFPFANPPYASRALAYLSVAQYDALVTVWHYKFQYNRPSPSEVDSEVDMKYHANDLPSYPSDGAAIAVASREILKTMFPLEVEYLTLMAEEHLQSLIWAGLNVQSDIDAGAAVGLGVANAAKLRASTDGMSKAQTSKSVSDSIRNVAINTYGWSWENQEIPARPVGLTPLFGKVKPWNMPSGDAARPGPPPAIGSSAFNQDVKKLKSIQNNLTIRQREIANYWADGLSTYTPPGHWNRIAKEIILKYNQNPIRSSRVLAYMNMAIMDAGISCWDAKYHYHYPRPIQSIPGFKTILGTPNFPAYTSGHSTFSAAAAEVLAHFFPNEALKMREMALESAMSRVYGGIHWTFDATVGTQQGKDVSEFTIARALLDSAE